MKRSCRRTYSCQIPEGSDCSSASDDDDLYVPPKNRILVYNSDFDEDDVSNDNFIIPASDEDPESDDDVPLAVRLEKHKKDAAKQTSNKKTRPIWIENYLNRTEDQLTFSGSLDLPTDIKQMLSPYEFFIKLFPKSLIKYITEQSNIYASQIRPDKPANILEKEVEQFIGICLKMSIVHLPSTRHHWGELGIPSIYNVMACNRFEEIKRFIHFNNNDNLPDNDTTYDKLFKVRPLLDAISNICISIPKEEHLAVDEQIIPTKSRSSLKVYNPKKPHKWGYKVFVLSVVSGFSYDFEVFTGAQTNIMPENLPSLSVSSNMVVKMAASIPRNCNYKLFFDNWFTSLDLLIYLEKEGILPLGTARMNRLTGLTMPSEKQFKELGRGSFCEKTTTIENTQISAVSWYDNKIVTLASTYVGSQPVGEKKRFFRSEKKYKIITCPKAIEVYNSYMGGVDILDSMLGYYRINIRSKKYYMKIFYHLLDLCTVNAWLLYRRVNKDEDYIPLVDFKILISEVLCEEQKLTPRRRGRPVSKENTTEFLYHQKKRKRGLCQEIPAQEIRLDGMDHNLIHTDSRMRCKYPGCKAKTMIKCIKCNIPLCLNKERSCPFLFHTV